MTYLLATYIREDMLHVTRSCVLFQGDYTDALVAFDSERHDAINEGYTLIDEDRNGTLAVLRGKPLPYSRSMYTTVLQVYSLPDRLPFWNEELGIKI